MVNTAMSEDVAVALAQQQISTLSDTIAEIKSDVKEIKGFIASLDNHYVTRGEFIAFKKQYWLSHTLTALITTMITGLVFYFLSHGTAVR